jgi:secreted PhoX family phosphatase
MSFSRRAFLRKSSAYSVGFFALRQCVGAGAAGVTGSTEIPTGYGPLVPDPRNLLDLPKGFAYQVISRSGDPMDDGLFVPGEPDGMASFEGPDGTAIIVRNHEMLPYQSPSPFGERAALFSRLDRNKVYDGGEGKTPHLGGTTTIVYDTKSQKILKQFMSLAGTARNCAGGPTPWQSWVTCEETIYRTGKTKDGDHIFLSEKDHGYCFDVPATAEMRLADPIPLVDMGRFNHEAIAVDPRTGIVYETEDRDDGLFYRFLPNKPGELKAGGRLQALCVVDFKPNDTRNWGKHAPIRQGDKLRVTWMDMDHVESPEDDLRKRGHDAGAARFARGEGIWHSDGHVYISCTNGGTKEKGQIWRYLPAAEEGQGGADDSGTLELFIESHDSNLLEACDNITMSPWGDLIVCEDRSEEVVRLVGVTMSGQLYTLANSHAKGEFAGVTFTPDGSTLLVNIQHSGLTVAITGPWRTLA